MPQLHLTDLTIQALKTPTAQADFYCARTPRFGIRVTKSGRKTFFVFTPDRRRVTLGRYPDVSLKDARRDALTIMHGADQTETHSPSLLMHAAVDNYFRTVRLSPAWEKEQRRLITKHFLAKHGRKDIAAITTKHILQVTDALADRPAEQVHTHKALQTFFRWAVRRSLMAQDPMAHLSLPAKLLARDRVLSHDELRKVWTASKHFGGFGVIVRLLILTGQRRGEIANLHVAKVSSDGITWPKHIVKNRREHTIPLTPIALALATQAKPQYAWSKPKSELDKLSGVTGWTLHDLRRTFATNLAELGVAPHVIERILNHVTGSISPIARVYNRATYQKEMRDALELYERHLFTHVLK